VAGKLPSIGFDTGNAFRSCHRSYVWEEFDMEHRVFVFSVDY